jgi:hypothetical protein
MHIQSVKCKFALSCAAGTWFGAPLCISGSWRDECETLPQNYTLTIIYCSKLLVLFMTTNSDVWSFTTRTVIPTSGLLYITISAYCVVSTVLTTSENIGASGGAVS